MRVRTENIKGKNMRRSDFRIYSFLKGKLINILLPILLIFPVTAFAINPTTAAKIPTYGQKVKYFSKLTNYGIKSITHADLALASKADNITTLLEYERNAGKITDTQVYRYVKEFNSFENPLNLISLIFFRYKKPIC